MRSWLGPLVVLAGLAQGFEPARLLEGAVSTPQPPLAVGNAEVFLDVGVAADGAVDRIGTLRDTPPFTALLREAVAGWRFEPARDQGRAVAGAVLVAAVFRAPVLDSGPTRGAAAQERSARCGEIPFPLDVVVPPYPPMAVADRITLVEVSVDADGAVAAARALGEPGAFADAALEAARRWRFRAACRGGVPDAALAYVAFGFRRPVLQPRG